MGKLAKSKASVVNTSEVKTKIIKLIKDRYNNPDDLLTKLNEINPGDMFFWSSDYRDIMIVDGFKYEQKYKCSYLLYRNWDWETMAWKTKQEESTFPDVLTYIKTPRLHKHPLELIKEAEQALASGNVDAYVMSDGETDKMNGPETSLLALNSKENYESMKRDLEVKHDTALIMRRTMDVIISNKKRELEKITAKIQNSIIAFKKQIAKIYRVIVTLELYLGIQESIIQIQEGQPASVDDPIHIRQGLMYMDEEVGDPWDTGEGISWKQLSDFDQWLTRNDNYKKVIPEKKGIAAFKARREKRDTSYIDDAMVKMNMAEEDEATFLLMRNGDNLYRIITDKIEFRPRLFPKRNELQKAYELYRVAELAEEKGDDHIWSDEERKLNDQFGTDFEFKIGNTYEETKEMAEDHVFFYKMRFALLQGILERTQIFAPTPEPIKLFDAMTLERGLVRLVYDDELTLPSHRKEFWTWIHEINQQITFGSRIVLATDYNFKRTFKHGKYAHESHADRLDERYEALNIKGEKNWNLPPPPTQGLYYVEERIVTENEPIWIDNPKFDPSKPKTPNEERVDPFDKENKKFELYLTYTQQKYWFGKVIKKDTFEHFHKEKSDDEKSAHVPVDRNSEKIQQWIMQGNNKKFLRHNVDYKRMCIRYNPKDEIQSRGWVWKEPSERKNRISWLINTEDKFLLNYDLMKKEDLMFYIHSRIDRRHYIAMMPILAEVLKVIEKEEKDERDFKKLVKGEVYKKTHRMPADDEVDNAILEWKTGLKWKRAISHDDEKALRMIIKKLTA
jgi:hypothetical protein